MFARITRYGALLVAGATLLQFAGCAQTPLFEALQTVFLGVTAVASYMIIREL